MVSKKFQSCRALQRTLSRLKDTRNWFTQQKIRYMIACPEPGLKSDRTHMGYYSKTDNQQTQWSIKFARTPISSSRRMGKNPRINLAEVNRGDAPEIESTWRSKRPSNKNIEVRNSYDYQRNDNSIIHSILRIVTTQDLQWMPVIRTPDIRTFRK